MSDAIAEDIIDADRAVNVLIEVSNDLERDVTDPNEILDLRLPRWAFSVITSLLGMDINCANEEQTDALAAQQTLVDTLLLMADPTPQEVEVRQVAQSIIYNIRMEQASLGATLNAD
jgi:hypothetical protein